MGNVALAFPNRFDGVALSGQGWYAKWPLSYLSTKRLAQLARAQQPIARLYVNKAGLTARLVGLLAHNLSTAGRLRVRAWGSDPRTPLDASSKAAVLDLPFSDWTALPSGLAFISAAGYYWGADGLLKTAAANTPRFTHDRATGSPIGLLLDGFTENRALWCRDGTNAAWTKDASMGTALSATGIDGVASTATRLTANAANQRIYQSATGSGTLRFGVWLRRVSGSGTISLTGNSWGGTTAVTLTSSWQFFSVAFTSGNQFGIQIATSGDVIEMDFAFVGAFASTGPGPTPLYTTGATVTRAGDTLTYTIPAALQPSTLNGGLVWRGTVVTPANVNSSSDTTLLSASGATSLVAQLISSSSNALNVSGFSATLWTSSAPTLGTQLALAVGWAATNTHYGARNGSAMTAGTAPNTVAGALTSLSLSPANHVSIIHNRLSLFSTALNGTDTTTLSNHTAVEPTPAYDSGWLNAWPASWVSGTTAEQRTGARGVALADLGSDCTYAWWRIDLSDPANTAGYVQLGRVFMGGAWQPITNMSYGAGLGYLPRASISESDSGAESGVSRPNPRVAQVPLDWLSESEALDYALEMQRQLGTTEELLYAWDLDETRYQPTRCFLARLQALPMVKQLHPTVWAVTLDVKERL